MATINGFPAKFPGTCPACELTIKVGDSIAAVTINGRKRYAHASMVCVGGTGHLNYAPHAGTAREAARGVGELHPDHIGHPENAEHVLALHECDQFEELDAWTKASEAL